MEFGNAYSGGGAVIQGNRDVVINSEREFGDVCWSR
jgi:hypothetical protein